MTLQNIHGYRQHLNFECRTYFWMFLRSRVDRTYISIIVRSLHYVLEYDDKRWWRRWLRRVTPNINNECWKNDFQNHEFEFVIFMQSILFCFVVLICAVMQYYRKK